MQTRLSGLKKLLYVCQLIAVTGCHLSQAAVAPGNRSASELVVGQSPPQLKNFHQPGDDPNQDSDLWVNIFHEDFADEASSLAIVANNNSQYGLELVGCDEHNYLTNKLTSIPAGYRFPLTRYYDQRWQFLDSIGKGLFDSHLIERNSLTFTASPQQAQFGCYYRVFVPAAADSLYIKLVSNLYTVASYSADGKTVLSRPHADQLLATQSNLWWEISSMGTMDILAGVLSYKFIVKRFPSFNPAEYLQAKLNAAIDEWLQKLNQTIQLYRNAINATPIRKLDAAKLAQQELSKMLSSDNRYLKIGSSKFFSRISTQDLWYIDQVGFDRSTQKFFINFRSQDGSMLQKENVDQVGPYLEGDPLPSPVDEINRLNLNKDPEVFLKLFGRGKYAGSDSEFAVDLGYLERMGLKSDEIISYGAANIPIDLLSLGLSAGVTLAFAAIQYYLIQPLVNGIFDQPAVGTFSTGINHLRFAEVNAADAAAWNLVHDQQHQIAANSKLTLVAKNSIFQYVKFSFADPNIDSQFNLGITLAALTTPWIRYAAYNPFADNRDPYLGCVDKNGRCSDGTPTHKADAVISMTISDNQPSPTNDLDSLYRLASYQALGLEELASKRLLPAPSYSGGEWRTNLTNGRLIPGSRLNQNSQLSLSDGLKPSPLKKEQLANWQDSPLSEPAAIMLNSQQSLDLMVTLPLVGAVATPTLYGGGFGVRYFETRLESTLAAFSLINNRKQAEEFSHGSTANILLAQFSCPFPIPVGQGCQLHLALPGRSDGRHHQGLLLIADANSYSLALPVYFNYQLISQPALFSVAQGDRNSYQLELINAGAEDYLKLELSDLPQGSQIKRDGCTSGLTSGASCRLEFDFAGVSSTGTYQVTITGSAAGRPSGEADQSQLSIEIIPGF